MDPSVVTQAQRGLDASWATPLKFWSARHHRTENAEQALDQLQLHAEAKPAVELARAAAEQAPERKLELYRVALEALGQATTTAAAGPMAGLALKLLNETQLVGAKREEAAARLFDHTPTTLAVRTLLAETPAPQRLQLVHECATREAMALRLPDPRPLEVARESDAFQALPEDAPHNELARSFLEHPESWMASWLQAHRDHPQAEKLARWTIAQAPESDWKKHDDPLAVAMHIHQSYTVENLVKAALDSQHPEKWLGELRTQAQHRPQEGALNLVGELPAVELRKGLELIDKGANAAALATHFPALAGIAPREGFLKLLGDLPEVVQARCLKASGEQPENLAAIAFRTAGATPDLRTKFRVAQLGLIELDRTAGRKPATRLLWNLTRLHLKTPHPQAAWLRTAMALEGLAVASRGTLPESPRGLVELGIRMMDSSFMVPSWFAPVATTVIETLQDCASTPLESEMLEKQKRQLLGRVQPEDARKALVELRELMDSTPYRLSKGERRTGISEEEGSVIVGGVKVNRKGQDRLTSRVEERAAAESEWPELKPDVVKSDFVSAVEVRTATSGSVQGVFNPNTGVVEWETSARQLAGAYDPRLGEVKWVQADNGGIAALYSPLEGRVVSRSCNGTMQGLFNPVSRKERFESVYTGRRPGAVRPLDGREHWESCTSGYNSGVYDPEREDFRFETSYSGAIAVVSNDPSACTLASNGTGPSKPGTGTSWTGPR